MSLKEMHPSNRLYRGDITNFEEAMKAVEQECQWEKDACQTFDAEEAKKLGECLDSYSSAARRCLFEYHKRVTRAANELYAEFAKSDDEDVRRIGEAGLSGDYSSLAI